MRDRPIGAFSASILALLLLLVSFSGTAICGETAQRVFSSPEEARAALIAAAQAKDRDAMTAIFGPVARELEPDDPVELKSEFDAFSRHVLEGIEVENEGVSRVILKIGAQKWPFPVPLVKEAKGWRFDTASGREEILNRRIGHNEFLAINVCRAYVEAQRDYYDMVEPDGDQLPKYAQHLISRPGRRDGLYWPTAPGEKESPLGPLVAKAKEEGYFLPAGYQAQGPRPFHGYYFRILKSQGESAPGGKFSYVINGNMVAGHALIAYPSRWGVSGVMTFIVNQRGRVYQKNLGPKTLQIARKIKAYNPDLSWKVVQ